MLIKDDSAKESNTILVALNTVDPTTSDTIRSANANIRGLLDVGPLWVQNKYKKRNVFRKSVWTDNSCIFQVQKKEFS